jgi:phosphatidylserine/phosphatidylglycerophosphate/cardiolipin synthase-like enzyme
VVVHEIEGAQREILLQAYGFTSEPIAAALVAAKARGVTVRAIFDKSDRTARGSRADDLAGAGVPLLVDTVPGIAHNKVLVIDSTEVITGSFNFTASAQKRNAENLLVIHDNGIAAQYRQNWLHRETVAEEW